MKEDQSLLQQRGWGKGQGPCHLVYSQGYDPENCMCRFTVSLRDSKFVVKWKGICKLFGRGDDAI